MYKNIKFIPKCYNFHAKSFKFGFFSDFRVINCFWLMAPDYGHSPKAVIADLIRNLLSGKSAKALRTKAGSLKITP